ncbi:MAG: helix-turn-helix domain-containing protein [Deltaproteobacteria bacterium]|nr:helix-turn-helix domain-containing protein [Deltaproteobacteria bacterium]
MANTIPDSRPDHPGLGDQVPEASQGHEVHDLTGELVDPNHLPVALTVAEVAALLRLDPRTVRRLIRLGDLEGNQAGHAIRVRRDSVLEWLRGKRASRSRGSPR